MSGSTGLRVNGEMLRWAREEMNWKTAGELAQALRRPADLVEGWEAGTALPTVGDLRDVSNKTKLPVASFFLVTVPDHVRRPRDFRKLSSGESVPFHAETMLAIREANQAQYIVRDLRETMGEKWLPMMPTLNLNGDVEVQARLFRELLSLTGQEQISAKTPELLYDLWRSKLESLDIVTLQLRFIVDDAWGFSLSDEIAPVAVVNGRIRYTPARIFTLLHETAHLGLGIDAISLDDYVIEGVSKSNNSPQVEWFCNKFAGAVLLPEWDNEISSALATIGTSSLLDQDISRVAEQLKVSRYVVLRRLLSLGKVSLDRVLERESLWKAEPKPKKKSGGRAVPSKQCIDGKGRKIVRSVVRALDEKLITSATASEYLGVRLKHLAEVRRRLEMGAKRE